MEDFTVKIWGGPISDQDVDEINNLMNMQMLSRKPVDHSAIDNISVYQLSFYGFAHKAAMPERWADPLRLTILKRLTENFGIWYWGLISYISDGEGQESIPIETHVENLDSLVSKWGLNYTVVTTPTLPKLYLEIPNNLVDEAFYQYWKRALPGYTIEGYNMEPGEIDFFQRAHAEGGLSISRLASHVNLAFHTYPAENRDFVFLTDKMTLEELQERIDLTSLRREARELGLIEQKKLGQS